MKTLKAELTRLLEQAVDAMKQANLLPEDAQPKIHVEHARSKEHGDFATNLAMTLAKPARRNPRELAQVIVEHLPQSTLIANTEIAGPGFINFFIADDARFEIIPRIEQEAERFGRSDLGQNQRIIVEFVSANPTGPLHVGHGRGAAYGDALCRLLSATGHRVHREYYVNDAGRQMDILAISVWLRYLDLAGETDFSFPGNAYQGDYIWDIAATLHRENGDKYRISAKQVFSEIPVDDEESSMDALIARARELLGDERYEFVHYLAHSTLVNHIRLDLEEFGVTYDEWFSERSLMDSGVVDAAIERLQTNGYLYEKDGAIWFRSTEFGDEKDRVVVRENGMKTYFASDIAYHLNKQQRGFDKMIDVWGADHHGYIPRVRAAMQAMGQNEDLLQVLLVQFAVLYRGSEKVSMSTRGGQFVTLRELRHEVGKDAARFFYVLRKSEQHMDFDLELAKSESNDNPVYYVQYAHARICSVMRQLGEKSMIIERELADLPLLDNEHETGLINALGRYPDVVNNAARNREPHQIAYYLRDLAQFFHTYYNAHQFLVEDAAVRNARLALIGAVRQVLRNGLDLLGVSAPEEM